MINVHSRPTSPVLSASSPPSLVAESLIEETNTLILTGLSSPFFQPDVLATLRNHFTSYGELYAWAPLKSFGRIIMVYWNTADGERARTECDKMWLTNEEGKTLAQLRLYRGSPTEIDLEPVTLPVPQSSTNFLISPPGSPPVGWEPVEEDEPNKKSLAADLAVALERLQVQQKLGPQRGGIQVLMSPDDDDDDAMEDVQMNGNQTPPALVRGGSSATPPSTGSSPTKRKGLSVILQDCDYVEPTEVVHTGMITPDEGNGVWQGEMMRGGISQVKATVASMGLPTTSLPTATLGSSLSAGLPPRVPTPRPPPPSS